MREALLNAAQVVRGQSWLPAGAARTLQRHPSAARQVLGPAIDGLAMDPDAPRDLGFGRPLVQQPSRLHAALLERFEITRYSCRMSHALERNGYRGICHYIM